MEVADQIAVMDRGVVEQVGGPPPPLRGAGVMSFIGPVNHVGRSWVRPHDLQLQLLPGDGADEAMIERIVDLGFEVRVELSAPTERRSGRR